MTSYSRSPLGSLVRRWALLALLAAPPAFGLDTVSVTAVVVPPPPDPATGVRTAVNPCQFNLVRSRITAHPEGWTRNRSLGAVVNTVTDEVFKKDAQGNLRYIGPDHGEFVFDRDCNLVAGDGAALDFSVPGQSLDQPALVCHDAASDSGSPSEPSPSRGSSSCQDSVWTEFSVSTASRYDSFGGSRYSVFSSTEPGELVFIEQGQTAGPGERSSYVEVGAFQVPAPTDLCLSAPAGMGLGYSVSDPFAPFWRTGGCSSFACDYLNPGAGTAGQTAGVSPMVLGDEGYMADGEDVSRWLGSLTVAIVTTAAAGVPGAVAGIGYTLIMESPWVEEATDDAAEWIARTACSATDCDEAERSGADGSLTHFAPPAPVEYDSGEGLRMSRIYGLGYNCGYNSVASVCEMPESCDASCNEMWGRGAEDGVKTRRWVDGADTPNPDDVGCASSDLACQEELATLMALFELLRTGAQWNGSAWVATRTDDPPLDLTAVTSDFPSACGGAYVNPGDDPCAPDSGASFFLQWGFYPVDPQATGAGWTDPPADGGEAPAASACINPWETTTGSGTIVCPEGESPDPQYPVCAPDGCSVVPSGTGLALSCGGTGTRAPGGDVGCPETEKNEGGTCPDEAGPLTGGK